MDRPVKYTFIPKKRDVLLNEFAELEPIKYYQIATFKNVQNLYHVRRVTIDGDNKIVDVKNGYFKKHKLEEFLENKRDNTYRTYPVYSLNTVSYPSASDISLARSNIIGSDYSYTGFSPYYCN